MHISMPSFANGSCLCIWRLLRMANASVYGVLRYRLAGPSCNNCGFVALHFLLDCSYQLIELIRACNCILKAQVYSSQREALEILLKSSMPTHNFVCVLIPLISGKFCDCICCFSELQRLFEILSTYIYGQEYARLDPFIAAGWLRPSWWSWPSWCNLLGGLVHIVKLKDFFLGIGILTSVIGWRARPWWAMRRTLTNKFWEPRWGWLMPCGLKGQLQKLSTAGASLCHFWQDETDIHMFVGSNNYTNRTPVYT